ncbi:MAG: hypothetical protein ACI9LU_000260 [Polaribacter sp.]|jgi:hypothetical protein
MRLVSSYQMVFKYIERFGLDTFTFVNHDELGNELIFVNGVKCTRTEYEADPNLLGFPHPGERAWPDGTGAVGWWGHPDKKQDAPPYRGALYPIQKKTDSRWCGEATQGNWKEVIEKYGKYSVRGSLKEVQNYSEGAIEMIEVMLNLE